MRRSRRRSPAGVLQVPIPLPPPGMAVRPAEPAIVRLAPDRTVLDAVWGLAGCSLALVWPDEQAPGGWSRAAWPLDPSSGRSVAPVDLHVGHVLEAGVWQGSAWGAAYGWVADVDERRFVAVPAGSAAAAVGLAARAFGVWRAAELMQVEEAWRQRLERAAHFRGRGTEPA